MASAARVLLRGFLTGNARFNSRNVNGVAPSRNAVTSTSGAILPKPDKIPFGVVRMAVVVARSSTSALSSASSLRLFSKSTTSSFLMTMMTEERL
ncbi:hypothetical protein HF521_012702 [Silurus meridionalis]|uniref:Essential MCU regulator, mitochondrial n=1 Tax=Silurus meridionalis TaxID=175797 RepID=A0A8T0ADJ6_SILME|nr:hypothetical protein HF521_012702 [Silurus meridionalis]